MNSKKSFLMNSYLSFFLLTVWNIFGLNILSAYAQITSDNTTGTIVNQTGEQFNITGGTLSGDGTNLFHSFSEFGLDTNQIANFLSNPNIANILSRITGGDPSYINGLIQVTGSNANLYLMNPAGIIFGNGASLNVPADFTATTATGITFGSEIFNAIGNNNYTNLNSNPSGFIFNTNSPAIILNTGDLTVDNGNNLTLIGGEVINTGNLTATEGNINIASVEGNSKLTLSQPGQILNLEINIPSTNLGNPLNITPLDLPQLLTGNPNLATGLVLTPDNTVSTSSGTTIPTNTGTTIITGNIDASSNTTTGGNISVLGNTIGLLGANIDVSGLTGGGNIYIGGEYQGQGTLPTAQTTVIDSNTNIKADAILSGDGGTAIVWSDNFTNFLGTITAKGGINSGNGGFVETSSQNILNTSGGSVDASAINGMAGQWLLDPRNVTITTATTGGTLSAGIFTPTADNATINVTDIITALDAGTSVTITTGSTGTQEGNITVAADIQINPSADVNFTLNAANNIIVNNTIENQEPDQRLNVFLLAGNLIDVNADIITLGGNITLTSSNGSIDTTGGILNSSTTSNIIQTGGFVSLTANNGSINTGDIDTTSSLTAISVSLIASGGNINLKSASSIVTGNINASASTNVTGVSIGTYNSFAYGGSVTLQAGNNTPNSNITFSSIDSTGTATTGGGTVSLKGTGGDVTVTANGGTVRGISTTTSGNTIDTSGTTQGGTINITHDGGSFNNPFTIGNSSINGTQGAITTGTSTISPTTSFPVQFNGGTDTVGNINITSLNTAPTITTTSSSITTLTALNTSFTLNSLNLNISDVNLDDLIYAIQVKNGSITVNNVTYNAGETALVNLSDSIQYTPPTNSFGNFVAFQIVASDYKVTKENFLSSSNSVDITYNNELPKVSCNITNCNTNPTVLTTPGEPFPLPTLDRAREILSEIEKETGVKPAIIYVSFVPSLTTNPQISQLKQEDKNEEINTNIDPNRLEVQNTDQHFTSLELNNSQNYQNYLNLPKKLEDVSITIQPQPTDELELMLITPGELPIRTRVSGVTRADVLNISKEFQATITNYRRPTQFLAPAQELYNLFIKPLSTNLEQQKIENLVFIMDTGLRSLPLAALYDGQQYLVEKYSVGLMPSLSLTDTRYVDIRNLEVLAMGSETFKDQDPLPSVPIELATIQNIWSGESFLNQDFTENNLIKARSNIPYGIVHLATHGEFRPGNINNSYIQFANDKLRLDQIRELGLNNPPVELMVLSACRTALGDEDAELGFAGLAAQAGVKSALGSLWYVSDEGTLVLMSNFYQSLKEAPIKSEALRQAQLAMIKGQISLPEITENNNTNLSNLDLSHPYYWSGFTMVGNPW
jgi:filamentous hemagglutinin family protein